MNTTLLVLIGLFAGLVLIAVIIALAVFRGRRDDRAKRSWLAEPEGGADYGPTIIGTNGGFVMDGH